MGSRARKSLVGLSLALASVAGAQPNKGGASSNVQQAAGLVKDAISKSQKGDHQGAIDLYLQAYLLVPNAVLLSNVGTEFEAAGKKAEALDYFCRYLSADGNGANATYATQRARAIAKELGREESRMCEAPKVIEPPPPPPPDNGSDVGSASEMPPPPPPPPPAEHPGRGLRVAGMGLTVVGVALAGVGGFYAYKGHSLSSQIDGHDPGKPWPTEIDGIAIADWDSKGKEFNRNETIFFVAGAATIAGGIVLYFIGHSKEGHVEVSPTASSTGGGISLTGHF
jgi:hypothetical protein